MKFRNPLAVNENDSLGISLWKGMTNSYIKSALGTLAGLGVVGAVLYGVSKKVDNSKTESREITEEEVQEALSVDRVIDTQEAD